MSTLTFWLLRWWFLWWKRKGNFFKKDRCVVKVNILCGGGWLHFQKKVPSSNLPATAEMVLSFRKICQGKKNLSNRQKKGIENIMGQTKKDMILVWSVEKRERVERLFGKSPRWWWWYGGLTSGWRVPFNQRSTTKNGGHNLMVGRMQSAAAASKRSLHIKMAANSLFLH